MLTEANTSLAEIGPSPAETNSTPWQYRWLIPALLALSQALSSCAPITSTANPSPETLNVPRYLQNGTLESTVLTGVLGTFVFGSIVGLASYGVIHNWHHLDSFMRKSFGFRRVIDWYNDHNH